ncbi:glycosyl hydrolase [Deinococcus cellulosilyticus]|uniref:glucan endo-1,3-beta-D-glucosidase n=1 Tax=Deinococcus cellulosilyticus (strain DSM 18568 / NBRC 106333 / KACC 11606 / 5516J-15) TaxID=1223518 RepID=A0A511MYV8_DEIC1|nr:glycosyl hydrolase [Deinococcus cellulosilyticus]GEM45478.1 hypothetical protein DC3_11130 [Deinococcus cellulosilyticus NBRC 106333 = KACC 11606]
MFKKGRSTTTLLLSLSLLLASCGSVVPQAGTSEVTAQDWGTTPPAGAKGGPTNTSGAILSPALTTNGAAKGKAPTNEFWSSLIFKRNAGNNYSENMFAHPLAMKAKNSGLEISYPTNVQIVGAAGLQKYEYTYSPDLTLGVSGLNSPDTKVDDYGDWTVTSYWSDGANSLRTTFGHGLPFVYATKTGGNAQVTFVATPTVWSNQGNVLGVTVNGKHYGIFAPAGATWNVSGSIATSSLAGKDYYSVAVLPDNSVNTLNDYKTYAYNFVTGSNTTWSYNASTATMTTNFNLTFTAKEGTATGTLMSLYRHQWMSGSPNTAYTYVSPRGQMKVHRGTSFSMNQKFQGVLPYFPDNGSANTLNKTELANYVNQANTSATLNPTGDSYWVGKGLGKLAELVPLAEQVGNTAAQTAFLDAIQRVLQDWLDGQGPNYFYYNPTWGTLIGYPHGYGSEEELNDHHFHWGYFIKAAALLAKYRPTWASGTTPGGKTWGASINDLIMDASNWTNTTTQFPRLRSFDPYAGHSWAAGHAAFASGNNQESSSEDMNFATALINWGAVTGNTAIRDMGIFLYTNETAAIEQYWFNQSGPGTVFPANYNYPAVGMVWGDGGSFSTWFSGEREAILGINLLPITAGSTYLGRNPNYLKTNYDFLGREPNSWKDIFWSSYSMYDAAGALGKFNAQASTYAPEDGETKAHTYQFLHSINAMGQVDTSVTANIPTYSVFNKAGVKTYVAFNPTASPITVNFSDGKTLSVPARQVVSSLGGPSCGTDTQAPSIPAGLISPSKTSSSVNLSWTASSDNCGVTAYEVYQNGTLKTTVTSGTSTSITGLTPNTTYAFKVRARDAANNLSAFTADLNVTTDPGAVNIPGTVTTSGGAIANGTSKSFPVNVTSAGTYRLSIQNSSTLNSRLINVSFNGINYDLASDAGQTVIADFPNVGTGAKTIVITAKSDSVVIGSITGTNLTGGNPCDTDTQAPTVPAGLTSPSKTSSSVNLSWSASSDNCGVTAYEVYQNGTLKTTVTSGTSTSITGLTANTSYLFKVRAKDAKGNLSAFTADLNVTTNPPVTDVPGVVSTNVGAIPNGTNKTFSLNVPTTSNVRILITSNSTFNSTSFTVNFNGTTIPLSINAGQTVPIDFPGVGAGVKTLTITATSANVSIGKLETQTY